MKGKDSKPHIGIFGRRNNGKSAFINSITGQETSIVSRVAGTTTDPVRKSIEIPGIGPVVMIDTAGMDDRGVLGMKRVGKTTQIIKTIDLAVLLITENLFGTPEEFIVREFELWDVPFVLIHNKSDLVPSSLHFRNSLLPGMREKFIDYSALHPGNKEDVIALISKYIPESAYTKQKLIGDLIHKGDTVLLITPIDEEAPENRMILPQVQVIRDILDNDGIAVVAKEDEIGSLIARLQPRPVLTICDSQAFQKVSLSVPEDIPLTSFSIVLAKFKGDFESYMEGTPKLSGLLNGDRVLILESCTHHVACNDIGREKIPRWLSKYTGMNLEFTIVPGLSEIPGEPSDYAMVIQCGGCMITGKQLRNRLRPFIKAGIPVSNYGMTIAYVHGIFDRVIAPFHHVSVQGRTEIH